MKRSRTGRLDTEKQQFRLYSYSLHYACFSCRKMFNKPPWTRRHDRKGASVNVVSCPQCGASLHNMGREFKPPRRSAIRQWRKVEMLFQRGYRWETQFKQVWTVQGNIKVGYTVPESRSPRARTLRDAKTDYPPRD